MKLQTKLFLSFLILSTLIIVVGFVFYGQLKELIRPLTPQSIPKGVDILANRMENNSVLYYFANEITRTQDELIGFLLVKNNKTLEEYYLDEATLYDLAKFVERTAPELWAKIENTFSALQVQRKKLIQLAKQGQTNQVNQVLISPEFNHLKNTLKKTTLDYIKQLQTDSTEDRVVAIKLATKHSAEILQRSLVLTIIIFFDAVVISLLFALIGSWTISRPINILKNDIDKINKASLDIDISPKLSALSGEVGELGKSFTSMIYKLKKTMVLRDKLQDEITRRVRYEKKQQRTAMRLREVNHELDQFAYIISHDLRAPLRAISSLTTWVLDDCNHLLPEESQKNLHLIQSRVKRLDNFILGILAYSHVAKTDVNIETVDVHQLLQEVIDNLAPPPNIKIIIKRAMPVIRTNKAIFMQVFLNLINNAIKYNDKPQGYIDISCKCFKSYYQFNIADNGPGIDPIYHEKIFMIFQTLQSRDTIESTGMGLAIIKKIIERESGKIWVRSMVGQGATFSFTWPVS